MSADKYDEKAQAVRDKFYNGTLTTTLIAAALREAAAEAYEDAAGKVQTLPPGRARKEMYAMAASLRAAGEKKP